MRRARVLSERGDRVTDQRLPDGKFGHEQHWLLLPHLLRQIGRFGYHLNPVAQILQSIDQLLAGKQLFIKNNGQWFCHLERLK